MAVRWINVVPPSPELLAVGVHPGELENAFDRIRTELKVPDTFAPEVLAEAESAATQPRLPDRDETAAPFLTIDPPGSRDLDQAMLIERSGGGYRLRYAIADVPAFVIPGGAVDTEARRRGQTVYAPDRRTPLHPERLGEDAASLLPGRPRPAYVWDIVLDADGEETSVDLYRAMIASHDRLDYAQVQAAIDGGTADERLTLLADVGKLRIDLERARGGASLPMPEQEVTRDADGRYLLAFRPPVPAEDWNAQVSLLTGMAAAQIMLHGGIGILRTMPEPEAGPVNRFRRQARALGVVWPAESLYGEFLRSLDRNNPRHLALVHEATALFRGAGYTPFDDGEVPDATGHAAVAAPYAHVTAPLRRLVDRFGLVVCEALCRGVDVPDWAKQALPALPEVMAASDRLANAVERACTDVVEAASLQGRIGDTFAASVVDTSPRGALVQVSEPAILAPCDGPAQLGAEVRARLVTADVTTRTVRFTVDVGGESTS